MAEDDEVLDDDVVDPDFDSLADERTCVISVATTERMYACGGRRRRLRVDGSLKSMRKLTPQEISSRMLADA
jgi:hypothetical protein